VKLARPDEPRGKGKRPKGAVGKGRGDPTAAGKVAGNGTGGARAPGADDDDLFEDLRALRRQIADREGVPAYVIFHDATLREMAEIRPSSDDELLEISGVGERKLEKYGGEFLALLSRWAEAAVE